ncbi:MAG TPA: energy-coupling factor transporter transmembrane component T [Candidatus Limnocylindria bacterium]|nr:energy-coupling factor transporter transmembrane component T [Candidatus Limnocylindria bacterium]
MIERWRAALPPLLLGAMLGALVAGRFAIALACVVVALLAAWRAGAARPRRGWLVTLALTSACAWALNLYLTPGRPLGPPWPELFGHAATREGLALGTLLGLRVIGAFAALAGLRAAWPGERAADEAARWLSPLRHVGVPIAEARVVTGLAVRFAPLLRTETARIARVQDLRAGRPPRGIREWLVRRRATAVPTLVATLERAERVALALEARHYRLRPTVARAPAAAGSWATAGVALGTALALVALLWRG